MDWVSLIAGIIQGITAPIANAITGVKGIKAQIEINRDNQLSRTNRAFSTNAMLSGAIPMIALILIIVIIINSKNNKK
jgi:hypothetical protein